MNRYKNSEFSKIVSPILGISDFNKLKEIDHHGITRYDHSLRVAYHTYKITKFLHLNYKEATIAALVHDFFIDEVEDYNGVFKLRRHPDVAFFNASKYLDLSEMQEDIIKTHMFPVTFTPPKYLESWIVDVIDDVAAIYEKSYTTKNQLSKATMFIAVILINYFRVR